MSAEHEHRSWCRAALPHWIFAGPASKAEFDKIQLPVLVGEWQADRTETAIRNDGNQYEHQCHCKVARDATAGVEVIFQWFEYRIAGDQAVLA